ncbi:HAMP domain-containing protein [Alistipes putredinis]|uniref:HAMP domain-containing protein n=1 Tax=Alistipes putredinis TaxID=28117 RepID=UPI003AB70EF8
MLIIPCSLVVIITAVIFTGFVYRFDGTDVRTQLTDSLGFISVYQLQFHVNQLEKEVLQTGENVSEQEEIVSMCKELEDTGALVAILFDNVPAYSTPGYTLEEWETEVEKIASGANFDEDSLLYTSSRGTILSTVTHAADGRRLCILICDPTLVSVVASTTEDLPKRAFEYMDTMGWVFIGLAILVTLATDIILVTFISRGILVPLDKLRRATHEIRDGNLDYRVDYEGKNELGDVCADFDEMRLRLRDSVKSQQRYTAAL